MFIILIGISAQLLAVYFEWRLSVFVVLGTIFTFFVYLWFVICVVAIARKTVVSEIFTD
jgi:hypothetical protein